MIHRQRKTIELDWRDELENGEIKGMSATISVGDDKDIRTVDNDGLATVTYPQSFTGPVSVTVRGSKGGEAAYSFTVN